MKHGALSNTCSIPSSAGNEEKNKKPNRVPISLANMRVSYFISGLPRLFQAREQPRLNCFTRTRSLNILWFFLFVFLVFPKRNNLFKLSQDDFQGGLDCERGFLFSFGLPVSVCHNDLEEKKGGKRKRFNLVRCRQSHGPLCSI